MISAFCVLRNICYVKGLGKTHLCVLLKANNYTFRVKTHTLVYIRYEKVTVSCHNTGTMVRLRVRHRDPGMGDPSGTQS